MVARALHGTSRRRRRGGRVGRAVQWWRTVLSTAIIIGAGKTRAMLARVAERRPTEALRDLRRLPILWVGLAALGVGVTVSVAVAVPGPPRTLALLAGATSIAWAGVRWLVLLLAADRLGQDDVRAVRGAFSVGLIAYALAFSPTMQFAAWTVAGVATAFVLWRLGTDRRAALGAVGVAWGVQALGVAAIWLARNAYVIVTGFRR
jgi:hypothetical protein